MAIDKSRLILWDSIVRRIMVIHEIVNDVILESLRDSRELVAPLRELISNYEQMQAQLSPSAGLHEEAFWKDKLDPVTRSIGAPASPWTRFREGVLQYPDAEGVPLKQISDRVYREHYERQRDKRKFLVTFDDTATDGQLLLATYGLLQSLVSQDGVNQNLTLYTAVNKLVSNLDKDADGAEGKLYKMKEMLALFSSLFFVRQAGEDSVNATMVMASEFISSCKTKFSNYSKLLGSENTAIIREHLTQLERDFSRFAYPVKQEYRLETKTTEPAYLFGVAQAEKTHVDGAMGYMEKARGNELSTEIEKGGYIERYAEFKKELKQDDATLLADFERHYRAEKDQPMPTELTEAEILEGIKFFIFKSQVRNLNDRAGELERSSFRFFGIDEAAATHAAGETKLEHIEHYLLQEKAFCDLADRSGVTDELTPKERALWLQSHLAHHSEIIMALYRSGYVTDPEYPKMLMSEPASMDVGILDDNTGIYTQFHFPLFAKNNAGSLFPVGYLEWHETPRKVADGTIETTRVARFQLWDCEQVEGLDCTKIVEAFTNLGFDDVPLEIEQLDDAEVARRQRILSLCERLEVGSRPTWYQDNAPYAVLLERAKDEDLVALQNRFDKDKVTAQLQHQYQRYGVNAVPVELTDQVLVSRKRVMESEQAMLAYLKEVHKIELTPGCDYVKAFNDKAQVAVHKRNGKKVKRAFLVLLVAQCVQRLYDKGALAPGDFKMAERMIYRVLEKNNYSTKIYQGNRFKKHLGSVYQDYQFDDAADTNVSWSVDCYEALESDIEAALSTLSTPTSKLRNARSRPAKRLIRTYIDRVMAKDGEPNAKAAMTLLANNPYGVAKGVADKVDALVANMRAADTFDALNAEHAKLAGELASIDDVSDESIQLRDAAVYYVDRVYHMQQERLSTVAIFRAQLHDHGAVIDTTFHGAKHRVTEGYKTSGSSHQRHQLDAKLAEIAGESWQQVHVRNTDDLREVFVAAGELAPAPAAAPVAAAAPAPGEPGPGDDAQPAMHAGPANASIRSVGHHLLGILANALEAVKAVDEDPDNAEDGLGEIDKIYAEEFAKHCRGRELFTYHADPEVSKALEDSYYATVREMRAAVDKKQTQLMKAWLRTNLSAVIAALPLLEHAEDVFDCYQTHLLALDTLCNDHELLSVDIIRKAVKEYKRDVTDRVRSRLETVMMRTNRVALEALQKGHLNPETIAAQLKYDLDERYYFPAQHEKLEAHKREFRKFLEIFGGGGNFQHRKHDGVPAVESVMKALELLDSDSASDLASVSELSDDDASNDFGSARATPSPVPPHVEPAAAGPAPSPVPPPVEPAAAGSPPPEFGGLPAWSDAARTLIESWNVAMARCNNKEDLLKAFGAFQIKRAEAQADESISKAESDSMRTHVKEQFDRQHAALPALTDLLKDRLSACTSIDDLRRVFAAFVNTEASDVEEGGQLCQQFDAIAENRKIEILLLPAEQFFTTWKAKADVDYGALARDYADDLIAYAAIKQGVLAQVKQQQLADKFGRLEQIQTEMDAIFKQKTDKAEADTAAGDAPAHSENIHTLMFPAGRARSASAADKPPAPGSAAGSSGTGSGDEADQAPGRDVPGDPDDAVSVSRLSAQSAP